MGLFKPKHGAGEAEAFGSPNFHPDDHLDELWRRRQGIPRRIGSKIGELIAGVLPEINREPPDNGSPISRDELPPPGEYTSIWGISVTPGYEPEPIVESAEELERPPEPDL